MQTTKGLKPPFESTPLDFQIPCLGCDPGRHLQECSGPRAGKCPAVLFECFWAIASECPKECFLRVFWRLGLNNAKKHSKAIAQKHSKSTPRGTFRPGALSTLVNGGRDRNPKGFPNNWKRLGTLQLRLLGRHICRTKLSQKNVELNTKNGAKSAKNDPKNDPKCFQKSETGRIPVSGSTVSNTELSEFFGAH